MDQAVRNLFSVTGLSLREAVRAATLTPARVLRAAPSGAGDSARGEIVVGGPADLVILDEDLGVAATLIAGSPVHDPGGLFTFVATM
ncbi:MAG: hypothetical protein ACYCSF_12165 [Acidimicrobiales bacterium]